MTPDASLFVRIGIPGLALAVLAIVLFAVQRVLREPRTTLKLGALATLWLAYAALLAHSGLLARSDLQPPAMLLLFVPLLALSATFAFSGPGTRLAEHTPLRWLVALHAFRFPLELVMHEAAREGVMPEQMTFTGASFDILSGLAGAALALGWNALRDQRAWAWAFNVLGSALLLAIICIAVASLPAFQLFGSEPERQNTWVAHFPYVWLPAGLVTAALSGHLLLWRRLLTETRSRQVPSRNAATLTGLDLVCDSRGAAEASRSGQM